MKTPTMCRLMVVDVGNSAVKLSCCEVRAAPQHAAGTPVIEFASNTPQVWSVPDPGSRPAWERAALPYQELFGQVPDEQPLRWFVASVNRGLEAQLAAGVRRTRPQDVYVQLRASDFPIVTDVEAPERVGTDRLAASVAANARRQAGRAAIIVDAGTAVTVDLVTADGVFRGGAILPGMPTAARALRLATDALPLLDAGDLTTLPPALGKSTVAAMRSGVVWGCVAAVRELVNQLAVDLSPAPEVFCTGGLGQPLGSWLNRPVTWAPQLVLHGIALAGYHHLRHTAGSG